MITYEWDLWVITCVFIFSILCLGFYIEHHKLHKIHFKQACLISASWILIAFIFNIVLWYYLKIYFGQKIANQKALEFFAGYIIEKSLSLDNVFVFALIFRYFKIPEDYQRVVLNYGIISAILLRLLMILAGTLLIAKFHWILQIFGGLLILSGGKILFQHYYHKHNKDDLSHNLIVTICNKYLRTTKRIYQDKLIIKRLGKIFVTPLFLTMVLIEISDIMFATDSIPVIFAITEDPFIIITSNIFAILGLRSLYFLLEAGLNKFTFLTQGLAIILIFIGVKMLFIIQFSILTTLSIIFIILSTCILLNLIKNIK